MTRITRSKAPTPRSQSTEASSLDLVTRARRGEREAFDRLVRLHESGILDLARRYVAEDDARDVAQRTFVRAFLRLGDFRGESAFGTWLRRIAHNLALNHVRDHRRVTRLDDVAEVQERPSPTGTFIVDDLRERLRAAVERLPAKQRLVVELRLFRDRSFREIAEIAECTEDSAKANFHHATKRLRQWLS